MNLILVSWPTGFNRASACKKVVRLLDDTHPCSAPWLASITMLRARKAVRVQKTLWEMMRSILRLIDIPDWETLWRLIIDPSSEKATLVLLDTS